MIVHFVFGTGKYKLMPAGRCKSRRRILAHEPDNPYSALLPADGRFSVRAEHARLGAQHPLLSGFTGHLRWRDPQLPPGSHLPDWMGTGRHARPVATG